MPNRYEREIEEILRNLEQTDPKPGRGQKFGERLKRKPSYPRPQRRVQFSVHLKTAEWLLLITIVLALIAGGYAYARHEPDLLSGILAALGIVCLLLVALSYFLFQPRVRASSRYGGNVSTIRRGPLNALKTRWNLFILKMRYRRRR